MGSGSGGSRGAASGGGGTGNRALLVEDDAHTARRFLRSLKQMGKDARTVRPDIRDPRACIPDPGAGSFGLALVDLTLLGRAGLALIAAMRQAHPDCRIIAWSRIGNVDDALNSIRSGADDYRIPPYGITDLAGWLVGGDRSVPSAPATILPTVEEVERDHLRRALALCDGNVSAAARALGMERRTLQRKLVRMDPGRAA